MCIVCSILLENSVWSIEVCGSLYNKACLDQILTIISNITHLPLTLPLILLYMYIYVYMQGWWCGPEPDCCFLCDSDRPVVEPSCGRSGY